MLDRVDGLTGECIRVSAGCGCEAQEVLQERLDAEVRERRSENTGESLPVRTPSRSNS